MITHKTLLVFSIAGITWLTACSDNQSQPAPETKTGIAETNRLEITDAWSRPAKEGMMSAAYFLINNGTDQADTLLSAVSSVTSNTQIHKSYEKEDGLMAMEEQEMVIIPAKATTEFKQGGLHVMFIQLEKELSVGENLELTLNFSSGISKTLSVPVRAN
ncbi:MAG: copper chaperone PCu(A)C [Bacteroidota bacterium]